VINRKTVLFSLLTLATLEGKAQYDVSLSHYFDMEPAYNAAAVGKQSKLNITAAYAMDLAGFENNPRTMYAAADIPFVFLKQYHGGGMQFMNEQIGLFTHQRLALQYAYKHRLFGGTISVGASIGLISESFDGTKLDVEDTNDPALSTSKIDGNGLDVGLGLYYRHRDWYLGMSAQHLNAPLITLGETNELQIDATYYFTAGYNIRLRNPFITIQPTVLMRTDGVVWRGDITGRLVYTNDKKTMYCGLGCSPTNSMSFYVGGSIHGIMLGYSYELYTSAISPGNGSHELCVSYQVDINLAKKGKNKHKSVRIL